MLWIKLPTTPALRGLVQGDWHDHIEHILEDLALTAIKSPDGLGTYKPKWTTLLEVEYQIRIKTMYFGPCMTP